MINTKKIAALVLMLFILGLASCPQTKKPIEHTSTPTDTSVTPPVEQPPRETSSSKQKALKKARESLEAGDYKSARDRASKFISSYPSDEGVGEAHYVMVMAYLHEGRNEEVRSEFTRFMNQSPQNPWVEKTLYDMGLFYKSKGRETEARQALGTLFKKFPRGRHAEEALLEIALSYQRGGHQAEALKTFQMFIRYFPKSSRAAEAQFEIASTYLRNGQKNEANMEFEALLANYPQSERAAEAQHTLAVNYMRGGNEKEARQNFEKLLKNYPRSKFTAEAVTMLRSLEIRRMQEISAMQAEQHKVSAERAKKAQNLIRDMRASSAKGRIYVVLDLRHNLIMLKSGEATVYSFPCATGKGWSYLSTTGKPHRFATPMGKFTVINKKEDPAWIRPNWWWLEQGEEVPEGITWEERRIEGHLGKYSVGIGDGIFFHGFEGIVKPGKYTHGCIRMNKDDLEIFWNLVEIGAEVYIF